MNRRVAGDSLFWTEQRIEDMKRLFLDGLSAAQIAAEIGAASRNAVIGKLHRLGVYRPERRVPRSTFAKPKISDGRARAERIRRPVVAPPKPRAEFEATEAKLSEVEPTENARHLDILALDDKTCRFPFGNAAPFTYCGDTVAAGLAYCAYHAKICYRPPLERHRGPRPRSHISF